MLTIMMVIYIMSLGLSLFATVPSSVNAGVLTKAADPMVEDHTHVGTRVRDVALVDRLQDGLHGRLLRGGDSWTQDLGQLRHGSRTNT